MKKNEHTLVGKIARLPKHIREKLNRRLENGQRAVDILPWLNALPAVKKILAAQFDSAPIIRQNLDNWRAGGYRQWQQDQKAFARIAKLRETATGISRAGRGQLARAATTVASAKILELLNDSESKLSPDDLAKISFALATLRNADQNEVRLKYEKTRLEQRDEQLFLTRDKHQRDVTAIMLRVLHDDRAKLIAATPCNHAEHIEILGRHIFGELWEPRMIPPSPVITITDPPPKSSSSSFSSSIASQPAPANEDRCPPPKN
jgi:hypothetical protein